MAFQKLLSPQKVSCVAAKKYHFEYFLTSNIFDMFVMYQKAEFMKRKFVYLKDYPDDHLVSLLDAWEQSVIELKNQIIAANEKVEAIKEILASRKNDQINRFKWEKNVAGIDIKPGDDYIVMYNNNNHSDQQALKTIATLTSRVSTISGRPIWQDQSGRFLHHVIKFTPIP